LIPGFLVKVLTEEQALSLHPMAQLVLNSVMNYECAFKEGETYINSFSLIRHCHPVDVEGSDAVQRRMWYLQESASDKLSQAMREMRTSLLQRLHDP
jgi:hypothetical protein